MDVQSLRDQLKRNELLPVYLLYGQETYLCDLAARTIAEKTFAEGDFRDLNETTFSLNTADNLELALAAAEQLPMMASRRLVRVTDLRISATGFRDTIKEEHEAILSSYLANPSPDSVVILIANELNGNRKMAKLLKAKTAAVEFTPLSDADLVDWAARRQFKDAGIEADSRIVNLLVSRVGPGVRRLTNEINKLAAAALPGKTISPELIESLVPDSRELSNFAFTDHLIAGRKNKAVIMLRKILDDGAEPVMLIGSISYAYRRLLIAKDMMERGLDRREIANVVKLRYSDHEPFLAAARRASMNSLTHAVKSLAVADVAIKTSIGGSTQGARMQIETLVCELASLA